MSANSDNSIELPTRTPSAGESSEPTSEAGAEQAPFTRAELRALSEEIPDRLPAEEEMETRVVLVDIDPCHVHIYWHVRAEDLAAAGRTAVSDKTDLPLLLRLHDAICTVMAGFIPWPPLELEVSGLDGYRCVEIPDCGKTLIAELGLRGMNGGFTRLASSHPVRLPQAGRAADEIPERVELVLIDEPGIPPRVVEVLPPETGASPGETARDSNNRLPGASVAEAPAVTHGVALPSGLRGALPSPLSLFSPTFGSSDNHTEPWYWSGGPLPGFSGGEYD